MSKNSWPILYFKLQYLKWASLFRRTVYTHKAENCWNSLFFWSKKDLLERYHKIILWSIFSFTFLYIFPFLPSLVWTLFSDGSFNLCLFFSPNVYYGMPLAFSYHNIVDLQPFYEILWCNENFTTHLCYHKFFLLWIELK